MGQFRKVGVLAALGALLAAAPPALAGAHFCTAARPHHVRHIHPRAESGSGPGIDNGYYETVVGVTPAAPYPDEATGPYPTGYDGSSWSPTGFGVVYNTPPEPYLPPRIIYLNGRTLRRHAYPREHGVTVIRGGDVSSMP